MTKAQKSLLEENAWSGREQCYISIFREKNPLVIIFPLTFPSGWDPSRGQDAKFLPVLAPVEVVRNTEVIYSGEWISKWKMEMWGRMEEERIL